MTSCWQLKFSIFRTATAWQTWTIVGWREKKVKEIWIVFYDFDLTLRLTAGGNANVMVIKRVFLPEQKETLFVWKNAEGNK